MITSGILRRVFSTFKLPDGPDLASFIKKSDINSLITQRLACNETAESIPLANSWMEHEEHSISRSSKSRTYFLETYGCQMNLSDSEIIRSVLQSAGYKEVNSIEDATTVFANTCAIRENAEIKVWERLKYLRSVGKKRRYHAQRRARGFDDNNTCTLEDLKVGILGCMAERLKTSLLEGDLVDLVAGPDAYRDLPRLLDLVLGNNQGPAVNVQLSHEETYADLCPVRKGNSVDAFVSVMRGCNNMCTYCIVPFTRGRERSRALDTIVDEVRRLSYEGVKEVTLLGQNVNSYHDKTTIKKQGNGTYATAVGFSDLYRLRGGSGAYFSDLLESVAEVDCEMRIRFTSPHPKDFSDAVLNAIASRYNICSQIHLPAQSGSTPLLKAMRRGYTREAYMDLVSHVRSIIPGVCLSSDFISGFCGESEEDHQQTLSLIQEVEYDQAYMYAYSLRAKTHAARFLIDDVPAEIKQKRLSEVIDVFRKGALNRNIKSELNSYRVVLVEGFCRKSTAENVRLTGRTDGNKRVIFFGDISVPASLNEVLLYGHKAPMVTPVAGDYVLVRIDEVTGHTLRGRALSRTTLAEYSRLAGKNNGEISIPSEIFDFLRLETFIESE